MDKIVLNTLPNWFCMVFIIFAVVMIISLVTFAYTTVIDNEKMNTAAREMLHFTLIMILVFSGIAYATSFFVRYTKPYSITKTDDAIIVNSQSEWILNSTYTILTHKDGIYYLENVENPQAVIKLSDNEVDQLTSQK